MFSPGGVAFCNQPKSKLIKNNIFIEVSALKMDRQISLNLQVPLFTPEDKEDGIKKVENWLTEKHDGLFRAIIKMDQTMS